MHYVYIIYSNKLNRKYIGSTIDLKERIRQHNLGKSDFTSKGIPWKLIYYEAFLSKKQAQKEELFLKSERGRERLNYLFGD